MIRIDRFVTLRTKGNRKKGKDISREPEMIELKRMVRDGELSSKRTAEYLHKKGKEKA